jgi:hypothetical protein
MGRVTPNLPSLTPLPKSLGGPSGNWERFSICPAEGDRDQTWLDHVHPCGGSPPPLPDTRFPRDWGGFLGTGWHEVSQATWAVPGEHRESFTLTQTWPDRDARFSQSQSRKGSGLALVWAKTHFQPPPPLDLGTTQELLTPHWENRARWPEGNKTQRSAAPAPWGLCLPAGAGGACISAWLGRDRDRDRDRGPATLDVSRFPRRIPLPAARGRAGGGEGWFLRMTPLLAASPPCALCCHGDSSILAALG